MAPQEEVLKATIICNASFVFPSIIIRLPPVVSKGNDERREGLCYYPQHGSRGVAQK